MARASPKLLQLGWLCHENAGLLLVGEWSIALLAEVLAVHEVDLSLTSEAYPWRGLRVVDYARWTLQAHALPTIDAACHSVVELAPVMGASHHATVLSAATLRSMGTIGASVSLVALADLLFWRILAFVRQIVRVCVLRGDLLNAVPKFGRIHSQHRLVDLVFQHVPCVFFVHQFTHARSPQALVTERSILQAFSSLL